MAKRVAARVNCERGTSGGLAEGEARELRRALAEFQQLLDPDRINALQPTSPSAVYTTFVTIWLMVYQRLHGGGPLSDAVAQLLKLGATAPTSAKRLREQTLSANTGGYSRARARLAPEVTRAVAQHVAETLIALHPPADGRRVFLLDGTTIPLAPRPELQRIYPPQTNQHGRGVWPILHLVTAHELESGCAVLPECGPKNGTEAVGEVELARRLLPRLPPGSLILGDRNFGVFALAAAAQGCGQDCLLRLTDQRFQALVRSADSEVRSDPAARRWRLTWRPAPAERRKHAFPADAAVQVWLHEIELPRLTLRLVTTLPDEGAALARLYGRRQDIETDIRDVKLTLRLEQLSARSLPMVHKELVIGLLAFNLVVQIRRLAARQSGVAPRRLGFKGVWSAIQIVLVHPGPRDPDRWLKDFELTLYIARHRRIPHRPGRSYPRRAHPQRHKSTAQHRKPPCECKCH